MCVFGQQENALTLDQEIGMLYSVLEYLQVLKYSYCTIPKSEYFSR